MILQMTRLAPVGRTGTAIVEGHRADGSPIIRGEALWRERGELFRADPETERNLLASGTGKRANLTAPLADLAEASLDAAGPCEAAIAALSVRHIRAWHAVTGDGGHWQPSATSIGPTRGGFGAAFRNAAEVKAHWTADPSAVPLFSFLTEHGFWRAYIWRNAGLREIATCVNTQ